MAKTVYEKHPLAIRWFHWINFPVLFIMVWSGICIYWANSVFTVTLFHHTFFSFFPDSWFAAKAPGWWPTHLVPDAAGQPMRLPWWPAFSSADDAGHPANYFWRFDGRLAEGLYWHFFFAWLFAINGALYVLYLGFSGQWRKIVPKMAAFRESLDVVLVDLHLRKSPLPVRKYNAAQQIAYTAVIVMGALMVLTGLAIYKPSQQAWLTGLFGGYTVARFIHFWTTMAFLAFFLVHVGQVIRTGWNNFRGMVSGKEIVSEEELAALV